MTNWGVEQSARLSSQALVTKPPPGLRAQTSALSEGDTREEIWAQALRTVTEQGKGQQGGVVNLALFPGLQEPRREGTI